MRIFDKKGQLVTPVTDQGREILVLDSVSEVFPTSGIYVLHNGSNEIELLVPLSGESVKYIKDNGGVESIMPPRPEVKLNLDKTTLDWKLTNTDVLTTINMTVQLFNEDDTVYENDKNYNLTAIASYVKGNGQFGDEIGTIMNTYHPDTKKYTMELSESTIDVEGKTIGIQFFVDEKLINKCVCNTNDFKNGKLLVKIPQSNNA